MVVTGSTPLPSPLGESGAEVLEGIFPVEGPIQLQHLAAGGNLQMTALAGDDLVHPLQPVPWDQAGLAVQPRVIPWDRAQGINQAITRKERKSTRPNSIHGQTSHSVFCLQNKRPRSL